MDKETSRVAQGFAKKVKKKYPDAAVYLFGSRARGDNWVTSDFDFIVVSSRFAGMPFFRRMQGLLSLWPYRRDADIICFTPEEMRKNKNRSVLLKIASRNWIQMA